MNLPIRNFDEAKRACQAYSYYKDIAYFDKQTHNMAWCLGFLASDGTIALDRNIIKIGLSAKDKEILEKIKTELKLENNITEYTTNTGFDVVELSWTCKEHKTALAKYGIIPQKTNYLKPPFNLNEKYWLDYLRGYFDGNGSICSSNGNLRFAITSNTKEILEWFVNWLYEKYNIPKINIHKDHNSYQIQYSADSTKKLYNLLYKDINNLKLLRKYNKYTELIK